MGEEEGDPVHLVDHLIIIVVAAVAVHIITITVATTARLRPPCRLSDREYHGLQIKKKRFVESYAYLLNTWVLMFVFDVDG